jgi:putative hydrolase of the HAD superfamily
MGEPWGVPSSEEMEKLNKIVLDTIGVEKKGSQMNIQEEFEQQLRTGKVLRLNPGCKETLEEISNRGIKLGILANGSSQFGKKILDRLGILDFFKIFIYAKDLGINKSQIEVYQIALQAMKTKNPELIVHVGDDLYMDVEMAQKTGMIPILFDPYNESSLDNVITIKELPELLHYLPVQ